MISFITKLFTRRDRGADTIAYLMSTGAITERDLQNFKASADRMNAEHANADKPPR